jgi:hypothetical protein
MNDKLANFLASINYKTEQDLGDLKIAKVILKKRTETFEVFLTAAKPLLPNLAEEIIESAQKGINGDKKCLVHFNYDLITDEDILITFKYLFNNLITKKPALSSLKDAEVNIDAGVITIEVTTKIEAELINDYKKELCQELSNLGFNNLDLNTEINQEKNAANKKSY